MFEIIFLIVLCGYFIQSILFLIGAKRKFPVIKDEDLPTATVVVAARNEEKNILRCLESLDELIYPEGKLEILMVDDKSTDRTGEIIDNFIRGKTRFKKIITKEEIGKLRGKTNALANALEVAKGDIILTTDADCAVLPTWVYSTAKYYQPDVAAVNGYTTQETFNGFSGMQSIDFIYLLTVAAGTTNLNIPITCIGNNMSYRRDAYHEVGGYEKLDFSVTEDFVLIRAIHKLKKYKIIFPFNPDGVVTSLPCEDLKELYRQRKRWAVGGLKVPFRGYIIMLWGFLANLGILLTPFFFSPTWLYLVVFKICIDFFSLYLVHRGLRIQQNLKYFLSFEIYYTINVLIIPFIVLLNRKVIWKEREY
jgi:cellulose synthase/poly-beta-1,6-N-acetylglucosamine synthase-like glycosyltransferase